MGVESSNQRQGRRTARTQNTVARDIVVVLASPSEVEVVESNRALEIVRDEAPAAARTFDQIPQFATVSSVPNATNDDNGRRTMDIEIQVARPTRVTNI